MGTLWYREGYDKKWRGKNSGISINKCQVSSNDWDTKGISGSRLRYRVCYRGTAEYNGEWRKRRGVKDMPGLFPVVSWKTFIDIKTSSYENSFSCFSARTISTEPFWYSRDAELTLTPCSGLRPSAGVAGLEDAIPDDVPVAVDMSCWLCG